MFQAYLITCLTSGRQYVGVTGRPFAKRWNEHVYDSTRRKTALARAIAKHGRSNFTIEALCSFGTWADACAAEDGLIQQHGTMAPNGYNVMPSGKGRGVGFVPSAESVERSAAKHRGLPCHENTRAAAVATHLGKPKSAEHCKRIAAARTGTTRTEATKEKIRAAWAKRRANGEFKTAEPYAHASKARKAASAAIAKIPAPLARYIAQIYYPREMAA
ncbi:MAG: GIY-YIG nuclease family protein [Gallionella sp.]|nr:GIY-YIG nuclease family protein [Gallionella sp.]